MHHSCKCINDVNFVQQLATSHALELTYGVNSDSGSKLLHPNVRATNQLIAFVSVANTTTSLTALKAL